MIYNIQCLRALACILVVLVHAITITELYTIYPFNYYKVWGQCGVDIFFTISGFIIVYILLKSKLDPITFIVNRMLRIVPMYWIVTITWLAVIKISHYFNFKFSINYDIKDIIASLCLSSQAVLSKSPILYVGWTLEWEMIFYVAIAIGLLFKKWIYIIVIVPAIICSYCFYIKNYIGLEFIAGMLIALMYNKIKTYLSYEYILS